MFFCQTHSTDNNKKQDEVNDDLSLFIDTDKGLIVILGCAHRGVINILRHAKKLAGEKDIYAVIGGAHLFRASDNHVSMVIESLREMGIKKLGMSHCTGFRAASLISQEFKDVFLINNAGTSFSL